ncbi:response regulator [Anaeromyxobacter sp. PSR-1]|uniref:response regulator n=1 Tax=unclassified Anaeromyxobacter TaxID=2620896 RepID=UPI0005E0DA05|nr:response regulator [Anaeromyxobacter sp. PSR-1]GAO01168.1 acetoacetate metabolism regulatory protein AtoC [Anaeromyxobacter sp. PSR-1]
MSLPLALLVDDSDAVLTFGRAALAGHFETSVASNGREALEKAGRVPPDVILLDLSMPEMDGAEVLARLKADPRLCAVPVIVLSSEAFREPEVMAAGADLFLGKPAAADRLRSAALALVEAERARRRAGSLAVLPVGAGPHDLALPLEGVTRVLHQVRLSPLPGAPEVVAGWFELEGTPMGVLDLAAALGVPHATPLVDRVLVVLGLAGGQTVALAVDRIHDPVEIPAAQVLPREPIGGEGRDALAPALLAFVRHGGETLPVLSAVSLVCARVMDALPGLMAARAAAP